MNDSNSHGAGLRSGGRLLAVLGLLGLLATPAVAGNFVVNSSLDDGGGGTLRAALTAAAADPDDDTITFSIADGSTITVVSALPEIATTLTFDTEGKTITVDGNGLDPYLTITGSLFVNGLSFDTGRIFSTVAPLSLAPFLSFGTEGTLLLGSDLDIAAFSFEKTGSGTATITRTVNLPGAISFVRGGTLEIASPGSATLNTLAVSTGAALTGDGSLTTLDFVSFGSNTTLTGSLAIDAGTDITFATGASADGSGMLDAGDTITFQSGSSLLGNLALTAGTSITFEPNTSITGNGATFAAPDIFLMGEVAPGTTAGMLEFTGNTTFSTGSTYRASVSPTENDLVVVTGSVTIESGAGLALEFAPGDYTGFVPVDILTADSIAGSFDVSSNNDTLFQGVTVDYPGGTSVRVAVTALSPDDLGIRFTPNQQMVLDTVSMAGAEPDGDFEFVQSVVSGGAFSGTSEQYTEMLDAIGGESQTAFVSGRQMLGERTARALHRRARDPAWGQARAVYAANVEAPAPVYAGPLGAPLGWRASSAAAVPSVDAAPLGVPRNRTRVGAWLDAYGQVGELEGSGDFGEADLDSVLYGGTLGFDVWLADRVILGLAAGYARTDLDPDDREGDFTADTIQGALYAGYADPRGYLSAYGRYAQSFQDSERRIEATQLNRTASASWDAQDWGVGAEGGVTLFTLGTFGFQPVAGVDWLELTEESYRESGAGSLALDVDPDDLESTTARFGARIFGEIDLDGTGLLVPELRAFWQREFGDRERVLRARLVGASTGGALAVRGAEMPRDVVILGLGWSADLGRTLQILFDYDALLDTDRVEHQGNLAVRVRF